MEKRGQITIFIIIAIVIVAGALVYLALSGSFSATKIPANLEPVYTTFLECIKQDTLTGISVLESQAGYIELPDFEPGSSYMPFSSQLNFLGNPVPYWYYVSGNNIQKEQVPTKSTMEKQLGEYIENKISNCNFQAYYEQGFEISLAEPSADININDNNVEIDINANLNILKADESVVVKNHKTSVDSKLGSLYDSAKEVYDTEQKNLFLEEYAIDTLRLYAPVDGTELTCSPLIWNANNVFNELQEAIEVNTIALRTTGDAKNYFHIDVPVDEEVRFLNSKAWPNSFEVSPAEGSLLVAKPVGNQVGLGILGFCYVPYHFVYSVKYPVLVQVYSGDEIFQFPMAVIIQNNNPRVSLNVSAVEDIVPEICQYKNTEITVNVKDMIGNPIKADISYECLQNECLIGETSESGILSDNFPQCVNGYVIAKAEGFVNTRYLFSSVSSGKIDIVMEKLHTKNIRLTLNGAIYNGEAMIYFLSNDSSQTAAYPYQKTVELAQGQYEIQVYIYRNSSINIGATTSEQCIDVSKPGILGVFGMTEQRCFEIEMPEQLVSSALAGGGKQNYFILESELTGSSSLEINAESLPVPDTLEKLQNNYLLFEEKELIINFI
ncbi:MAG: hypothetical protein ABIH65_03730 [Nanoarchaeota archaeon]